MSIYKDACQYQALKEKTYITVGTFDGVHKGHQKVIDTLVDEAKANNANALLVTFFPHPRMVLQHDSSIKLLHTIEERIQHLKKFESLDVLLLEFTYEFSRKSALSFIKDVLVTQLDVAKLFIGYDHRFGKNREGSVEQLREYAKTYLFEIVEISKKDIDFLTISSTKIRKALLEGAIEKATHYLGYSYYLTGEVVKGKSLGKTIGFPTANIEVKEEYKLIPKNGAYLVSSTINQQLFFGMMSIGNNPTVNGEKQTIEVHFFKLNESLYGNTLTIQIHHFLRDEQKFSSIEALKNQLKCDKEKSLSLTHKFSPKL